MRLASRLLVAALFLSVPFAAGCGSGSPTKADDKMKMKDDKMKDDKMKEGKM